MQNETIRRAMALLGDATPMLTDCGRLCGAACCDGSGNDGMLLFPNEACMVADATVQAITLDAFTSPVRLMVCQGHCDRDTRPLACRLFPLMAFYRKDGTLSVRTDARGRAVCPLCHGPASALSREFREKALAVYALLMEDPEQAAFLRELMALEAQFRLTL